MTETNFPTPTQSIKTGKNYKNAIIGALAAGLIAVSAYALYSNKQSQQTVQQQEVTIAKESAEKMDIQSSFDASLSRLDSLSTVNTGLNSQLAEKNNEIAKVKSEIRSILNNKNATTAELKKAKTLIASLNDKISSMEMDIAKLKQENQLLTNDNVVLKQEKEVLNKNLVATTEVKQNLEKKVEIASTLHASNIIITPVNIKNNGKEKVSTIAKRVDKIVVNFDVDNRIIQPGTTDVFVLVLGPDGKVINTTGSNETFESREDGVLAYTTKVAVDMETAKKKNVEFAFVPGIDFKQGNYTVQIYQNGFLIGQGTRELKKGGLFS